MLVHGLAPQKTKAPARLTEGELKVAQEAAGNLVVSASDELDRLFSIVCKAGYCILLADRRGVVLDRRGAKGDDREFHDLGLWTGTIWTEASVGTNGIGTALADERALSILRDQHFFSSNVGLSCTAALIRDHKGRLIGALDISTCREDADNIMFSILSQAVRDAAARIELKLFRSAFTGVRFILLPHGLNSNAVLAVDKHDMVVGATRAARSTLKLDDRRIGTGLSAGDALQEADIEGIEDLLEVERSVLMRALLRTNGNVSKAAIALGMSRATFHRKMKKCHLQ
jgi:transcriptional regulator of acetoin/glycerol metabolism